MSKLNELIAMRNELDKEIERERALVDESESELAATATMPIPKMFDGCCYIGRAEHVNIIDLSTTVDISDINVSYSTDRSIRTNYNKNISVENKFASGDTALSTIAGLLGNFFKG